MFSAYPDGWPGSGLLLLRAAAGSVLVFQGIAICEREQSPKVLMPALGVATALVGVLLCIGLLTRLATAAAALGAMGSLFSWFPGPTSGLFETRSTAVLALAIAAALAAVGPGAFSFDARLFGRREVIIVRNYDDDIL